MITVRAAKMPGRISDYTVETGATVSDVLSVANLNADGFEARVNGQTVEMNHQVSDGDTVLLVRKIKGN